MTSGPRRTQIDFQPLLLALEQPLQLIGDSQKRQETLAYIQAARPHVERSAFDVLSQTVTAFNDATPETRARLEYRDGGLQLVMDHGAEPEAETSFDDGDMEKVTLRLPRELKRLIDMAAGRHGLSANTWYVRELSRTIARNLRHGLHDFHEAMHDGPGEATHGPFRGRGRGRRHFGDETPD